MRDKKAEERWYVQQFLDAAQLPDCGLLEDFERPDFLIRCGRRRIGIEHTALHWDSAVGSPRRERESLRDRVCQTAIGLWDSGQRPHIEVSVLFELGFKYRKQDVPAIAAELVALVEARLPADGECARAENPWDRYDTSWPGAVHSITISRLVAYEATHWHYADADYIPTIAADRLQRRIREKTAKMDAYSKDVDEHWLVLTMETGRLSSTFLVPDETTAATYATRFSRVFLFEPRARLVVELSLSSA